MLDGIMKGLRTFRQVDLICQDNCCVCVSPISERLAVGVSALLKAAPRGDALRPTLNNLVYYGLQRL